jgi:hypothetical protein
LAPDLGRDDGGDVCIDDAHHLIPVLNDDTHVPGGGRGLCGGYSAGFRKSCRFTSGPVLYLSAH